MTERSSWLLLVLTLPTENATARMRFWRALKAMGCAVLRDGVYLLPAWPVHQQALSEMAAAIVAAGGSAELLDCDARDDAQSAQFCALFDRRSDYAAFGEALQAARKRLTDLSAVEANRLVKRLRRDYESVRGVDFFPGEAAQVAAGGLSEFTEAVAALFAHGEPTAVHQRITPLDRADYQGRTWATRRHLWVDRVATAWLIRRFIDPQAQFQWLHQPADCRAPTLGFDFDGAAFTHVGSRVTFEVLLLHFGLESDVGLSRLGALVHCLDVGGPRVEEAAGFEAQLSGARQRLGDDDALLAEMSVTLDSLYRYYTSNLGKES